MILKKVAYAAASLALLASTAGSALASAEPPPFPVSADQCKHDGWRAYGELFKNQGDCVSFVTTDGKNGPDGPPVH